MSPKIRADKSERKGAVVLLVAFFLIVIISFLAFSIDWGYISVTESELQNAADVGAISGARALSGGRAEVIRAANLWAAKNRAAGNAVALRDIDIELGLWNAETATFTPIPANSATTPDAVRVTCRLDSSSGNALPTLFGSMIGNKSVNISTSAVAQNKGGSCGGIMALEKIYLNDRQVGRASYTDSYDSTKGDYSAQTPGTNGDICTNGHLTLNGRSYVKGDARWWEQAKSPKATQAQVSGELSSFKDQIKFPAINVGNAASVNNNKNIPKSQKGANPFNNGAFTLTTSGDSVSLPPGTYYFSSMTVSGGSQVIVTGPTLIYVQGNIDLKFGGIDNTTRKPIQLQIYPMGSNTYFYLPFFGQLHASIYSTTAHIYLDEKSQPVNFQFFGKMVGQKIRVWDTALHVDESISFGALESGGEQIGRSGSSLVQ